VVPATQHPVAAQVPPGGGSTPAGSPPPPSSALSGLPNAVTNNFVQKGSATDLTDDQKKQQQDQKPFGSGTGTFGGPRSPIRFF
jgi:hypothetical protein